MANQILERTPYQNSMDEIRRLEQQLALLYEHGLGKLNTTLFNNTKNNTRKYLDFIAEHNFGAELIRSIGKVAPPKYEPEGFTRPPDFVVEKNGITFYMQMKNLSDSERENRRNKLVTDMKRSFEEIYVSKFISLSLAEDFNEEDSGLFVSFLKKTIDTLIDDTKLQFPDNVNPKVEFSLYPPNTTLLHHLTIGVTGNLEWYNSTGEAEQQIRKSISKALGAFLWDNDEQNINLIVMESDRYDDIDISQAVFGTEKFLLSNNRSRAWVRDFDGFFNDPKLSVKVCGVIALRRTDHALISKYKKTLFINEKFVQMVNSIKTVIDIDQVLTIRDLPTSD